MFYTRGFLLLLTFGFVLFSGADTLLAAQEYSLQDLYSIALEQSERIKISEEELYIAQRDKSRAYSAMMPDVSAFGSYKSFDEPHYTSSGLVTQPDYLSSYGVRIDQRFSLSGREFAALRIAKNNIEKNKYDLRAAKEGYLYAVSNAYYNVLKTKKSVEITSSNVERLTKHREAAEIKLKVGEALKTSLLRAEAELSGANADHVRAKNMLKLTRASLARLVGINDDYILKEVPLQISPSLELSYLKEQAQANRSEIKSLKLVTKISDEMIKVAKGAYWPTIALEAVYAKSDQSPESEMLVEESLYAGVTLSFPLYEGGGRKAEKQQAMAKRRKAMLLYEDLMKTINIEVEKAFLEVDAQSKVLESLENYVVFAKDNFNAVSKQFKHGIADSTDVMDANTLFLTSERRLTDAIYDYQLAILNLKYSTGTLLKAVAK